ncbi:MAG: enoyl-CoA hydratase/isomerase family protein [Pseudomonadota bacterium]
MEHLKVSVSDRVATLTMARPDALNAFIPPLLRELMDAIDGLASSQEVGCVVLEGEGRAFSAGVDLKMLQSASFEAGRVDGIFEGEPFEVIDRIRHCPLPFIAKVHGFCFTGALEMALHCDFILTTEDTKFGDTHAKFGVRPSWGMSQNLARAVGVRRARELSFTAASFSGTEAAAWGLANAAFPDKATLDAETARRAQQIAANSPGIIKAYKDLYRLHEENKPLETALQEEVARDYPFIDDTGKRLATFGQ